MHLGDHISLHSVDATTELSSASHARDAFRLSQCANIGEFEDRGPSARDQTLREFCVKDFVSR